MPKETGGKATGKNRNKLTPKQELFVQGLFKGMSQVDAYTSAYGKGKRSDNALYVDACNLANNPKIVLRLKDLTDELKSRNMVTVERVISELAKVGFANGSDFARVVEKEYTEETKDAEGNISEKTHKYKAVDIIPTDELEEDKLAAIAGIKATDRGIEVKTNDKIKALELMGKYLGMFTDKVETKNINLNDDVSGLSDEQIAAELEKYGFKKD